MEFNSLRTKDEHETNCMDRIYRIARRIIDRIAALDADRETMSRYSFSLGYDFTVSRKDINAAIIYTRDDNCPNIKVKISGDDVVFSICTISSNFDSIIRGNTSNLDPVLKKVYDEAIVISMANGGRRGKMFEDCSRKEKYNSLCTAAMNIIMKNPDALDPYAGNTWTVTKQEAYDDLVNKGGHHKQQVSKFLGMTASFDHSVKCGQFDIACPEEYDDIAKNFAAKVGVSGIPANLLYGTVELVDSYAQGNLIVDGDYDKESDSLRITINDDDPDGIDWYAGIMAHELGHRWWYKFASEAQKSAFRALYGKARQHVDRCFMPTTYSGTNVEEFVGDCFKCYYLIGLKEGKMKQAISDIINNRLNKGKPEDDEDVPYMDASGMDKMKIKDVLKMDLGTVTFKNVDKNKEFTIVLPVHITEKGIEQYGLMSNAYLSGDRNTIYYNISPKETKYNRTFDDSHYMVVYYDMVDRILSTIEKERREGTYKMTQDEALYQRKKSSSPKFVIDGLKRHYLWDENAMYQFMRRLIDIYYTKIDDVTDFFDKFDTWEELKEAYPAFDLQYIETAIRKTLPYMILNELDFLNAKYKINESTANAVSGEIADFLMKRIPPADMTTLSSEFGDAFRKKSDQYNKVMSVGVRDYRKKHPNG